MTEAPPVDRTADSPGPAVPRGRPRRHLSPFAAFSLLVAVALALLAIVPLGRVVLGLFYVDGAVTLEPIRATLALPDLGELLFNTVVVVFSSGILAALLGAVFAWLNERTDARMGFATDALPLLPFLLPPVAGAVGWVLLLSPRAGLLNSWIRDLLSAVGIGLGEGPFDIYTWYGLIAIYTVYQVPYVFLMMSAGMRNMDPSLEEQSRTSGAGLVRTLRKVTMPALAPSMGAAVLLMVWTGFGIFSLAAIVGTPAGIDVLSVRIVRLLSFTYPPETDVAIGLSGFVVLFVAIAYLIQVRLLRSGRHATVGGKGHRVQRIELGAWKWPARSLMVGYVLVSAVLPVTALVLVSLNGFWTPDLDWSAFSVDALREAVIEDSVTQRALRNSLLLGIGGGLIGILAAALVALFVARARSMVANVIDGSIKLPAAISNVVVAVGIVLIFAGPPFNLAGTLVILLMGYLALYMPQASVAADAAAGQVGRELPEASHIAGAGRGRTFRKVFLPLMVPGLVAGWALLFIRMAGDLTASAILAGTSNPVVGFRILEVYQGGSYALLAALSTVLVAITCTVLVVVITYTRRRSKWGIETRVGGI